MKLEHAMDNEFELVFVVGYQNFLQISYIGKNHKLYFQFSEFGLSLNLLFETF